MICSPCRASLHTKCANAEVRAPEAPGDPVRTVTTWCDCQHMPRSQGPAGSVRKP